MQSTRSISKRYAQYVSRSVAGMLGISFYILADTLFISIAAGSDGIAALNLCLPIYNFIFAIGAMIGMGTAIRYAVARGQKDSSADAFFLDGCAFTILFGTLLALIGSLMPDKILRLMGGDDAIMKVGLPYLRTFIIFTPFFMLNYVIRAFVRNDGDPSLAMLGTVAASLFNVLFDYILMFPMGMGMVGAALATAFSPLVSIAICSIHFLKKSNTIRLCRICPSLRRLLFACKVGISSFIGEFSSAVIVMLFNWLILSLAGNIGVAAYGVTANMALVATAIFNGMAEGAQPLVSECYGSGKMDSCHQVLRLGMKTAVATAATLLILVAFFAMPIAQIFNTEGSQVLTDYAVQGLRIYFIGFIFASVNMVAAGYLSAADRPRDAMLISMLRGVVLIAISAVVLSGAMGMTGIWLSFPTAEALTMLVSVICLKKQRAE